MSNLYDSENIKKLPKLGHGAPDAWKGFLEFATASGWPKGRIDGHRDGA